MNLVINNQLVGLAELREVWRAPLTIELGMQAKQRVTESNELITDVLAGGEQVYGVNTGFGQLAQVRVSDDDLAQLQENLVRSHAVGVGDDLQDDIVRLIMTMKVIALAEGFSGVRLELINTLCALINNNIYPCIPEKGSVGASGDLAPLAHMAGVLIGIGEARVNGAVVSAQVALQEAGIKPLSLEPKEGLALLNGTQVSTALALAAAFRTENVLSAALAAGAMSSDAIKGSDTPFDKRIQNVRGHGGQIAVAGVLRHLMSRIVAIGDFASQWQTRVTDHLATVAAVRRQEAAAFPDPRRRTLLRKSELKWPALSTPRRLLEQLVEIFE